MLSSSPVYIHSHNSSTSRTRGRPCDRTTPDLTCQTGSSRPAIAGHDTLQARAIAIERPANGNTRAGAANSAHLPLRPAIGEIDCLPNTPPAGVCPGPRALSQIVRRAAEHPHIPSCALPADSLEPTPTARLPATLALGRRRHVTIILGGLAAVLPSIAVLGLAAKELDFAFSFELRRSQNVIAAQ